MKEKIGFVGLGIMGQPMVANLVMKGFAVTVFGRRQEVLEKIKAAGAAIAESPRAVAEASDITITMVPDSPQVNEVIFGAEGLLEGFKRGTLYIDMSTIDSATSIQIHKKLAKFGVEAVDAPVSGGEPGAIEATLSIMAGGSEAAFQRARPVFEALGKRILHIGGPGAGQICKTCNQIAAALAVQGVVEAMTLAKKAGVDSSRVREVLLGGLAQSKVLEMHGQRIIDRKFEPGFKLDLYRKDLNIAQQTARALSVPLAGASLVACEMDALIAQGMGNLDFSALALLLEKQAGLA